MTAAFGADILLRDDIAKCRYRRNEEIAAARRDYPLAGSLDLRLLQLGAKNAAPADAALCRRILAHDHIVASRHFGESDGH